MLGGLLAPLFILLDVPMSAPADLVDFGLVMGLVVSCGMSHLILAMSIGALLRRVQESRSKRARLEELHARITKARERPA